MYDYIIVGCGYAGGISARLLAEEIGKKVLIIDRRSHIAGNMFDECDKNGILVHRYGPHISVMNTDKCYDFLSRFTEWIPYEHRVNAEIDGVQVPLPFNLTAVDKLFGERSELIKNTLIEEYGMEKKIPILDMLNNENKIILDLANYVYEKVFLHYTIKMWGLKPDEIHPSVTARVPFHISYDNRHFTHKIQVMPKNGFTKLFEKLIDHKNIDVELNTDALDVLKIDLEGQKVYLKNEEFNGGIIYTGAIDELLNYKFGVLPYRSLDFEFVSHNVDYLQETAVLNWPDDREATRRTEMKHLTSQKMPGITTTITEYPGTYNKSADKWNEPYYPIIADEYLTMYKKYRDLIVSMPKFYIIGRLAEYKYYNMEAVINYTLDTCKKVIIPNDNK